MMETGKTYRHAASKRVVRVDYVGTQTAVATTLEPGDGNGIVGEEVVIRIPEAGWWEYTPPKVYTKTVTISAWPAEDGRGDELLIHNGDIDIAYGQKLGVIDITYTEGGRLLTRVEQDV